MSNGQSGQPGQEASRSDRGIFAVQPQPTCKKEDREIHDSSLQRKCLHAFEHGEYHDAEILLKSVQHHNTIRSSTVQNAHYLIHWAAMRGWTDIVKLLVTRYNCYINQADSEDGFYTPLHWASICGRTDTALYLINNHCNIDAKDYIGETPLHIAARYGHFDIVQSLVEHHCDITAADKFGGTPLDHACRNNYNNCNISVIKYLISLPAVFEYYNKHTPSSSGAKGDAAAVIDRFQQVRVTHPAVGSFVNVFLLGNPGAGKTTLCQAIKENSQKNFAQSIRDVFVSNKVKKVKLCTAGIVPFKLCDKNLGNVIIHDFAGQSEYYSSHTAVLESLLESSGAIFVLVINLMQDLVEQVKLWSSIVENEHKKVSSKCHLIVIGSHADKFKETSQQQIRFDLENHFSKELTISHSIYFLDCRLHSGDNLQTFVESLSCHCTKVRNEQSPAISLYCDFLYAILEASEDNVLTLKQLMKKCDRSRQEGVPLPENIVPLLKTLHSVGLIVYLKNKDDTTKSWVVVSKQILLSEVDGILFAPSYFTEHRGIASNTGIITRSALQRLFPNYSPDMLIAFLMSMKLCEELDKILLEVTNLKLKETDVCDDQLLFFPALITEKRPEHIKKVFRLGWYLTFTFGHSFSIRFLHILLLYLAYQYSNSVRAISPLLPPGLERQCSVWINGIHWYNDDGVETLVEQVENSHCVMMLMSCEEGAEEDMIQLHCELTKTIIDLQKKYCPILQCEEYLLSPKVEYPLDKPSKIPHYDIEQLRARIRQGKRSILCVDATNQAALLFTKLFPVEPKIYLRIHEAVCSRVVSVTNGDLEEDGGTTACDPRENGSLTDVPVHVHSSSDGEVRNSFSDDEALPSKHTCSPVHTPKDIVTGALDLSDLDDALESVREIVDWKELGLKLGLHYTTLEEIDEEQRGRIRRCRRETIAAWLQGEDNAREQTWSTLVDAVDKIDSALSQRIRQDKINCE